MNVRPLEKEHCPSTLAFATISSLVADKKMATYECRLCQTAIPSLTHALLKHLQHECTNKQKLVDAWKQTTLMELATVGVNPVYWPSFVQNREEPSAEAILWFYPSRIVMEKEWKNKIVAVELQQAFQPTKWKGKTEEEKALAIYRTYNCSYRPLSDILGL